MNYFSNSSDLTFGFPKAQPSQDDLALLTELLIRPGPPIENNMQSESFANSPLSGRRILIKASMPTLGNFVIKLMSGVVFGACL